MKKILSVCCVALMAMVTFVSCSEKEEKEGAVGMQLVGKWGFVSVTSEFKPYATEIEAEAMGSTLTLNADGTMTILSKKEGLQKGLWHMSADEKMVIILREAELKDYIKHNPHSDYSNAIEQAGDPYTLVRVSDQHLVLRWFYNENGDPSKRVNSEITYSRIK